MVPAVSDKTNGTVAASGMSEFTHSFRISMFATERAYRLEPDSLCWSDGAAAGRVALRDFQQIRFVRTKMRGDAIALRKQAWCVELRSGGGRKIVLSPLHYVRFRHWQDRTASFTPFAQELFNRVKAANPQAEFVVPKAAPRPVSGQRHGLWAKSGQAVAGGVIALSLWLVRRIGRKAAVRLAETFMRMLGPWFGSRRVVRANLAASFPDKSPDEIDRLLRGTWTNLAHLAADFAFLDRLTFADPSRPGDADVEFGPGSYERLRRLSAEGKPVLLFGAHLANWELFAIVTAAVGLPAAFLYRPPSIGFLDRTLVDLRARHLDRLIPSTPGAGRALARALKERVSVGMLVDQHMAGGVEVEMFGRKCKANPLMARLARQFECPIHGGRVLRLADGRFRVDVTDAIEPPRDGNGMIDIAATMQRITSVIEDWIREAPEQWLWVHRRWR